MTFEEGSQLLSAFFAGIQKIQLTNNPLQTTTEVSTNDTFPVTGNIGVTLPTPLPVSPAGTFTVNANINYTNVFKEASASLNFPSIAAAGHQDLTIAVTGAAVGDYVALALPAAPTAGLIYQAWVSATNTVTVRATNITADAIDPGAITVGVVVIQV